MNIIYVYKTADKFFHATSFFVSSRLFFFFNYVTLRSPCLIIKWYRSQKVENVQWLRQVLAHRYIYILITVEFCLSELIRR